ncbi:hypothetical protein PanWU01x14_312500, partial [Parasponia andersonii]
MCKFLKFQVVIDNINVWKRRQGFEQERSKNTIRCSTDHKAIRVWANDHKAGDSMFTHK